MDFIPAAILSGFIYDMVKRSVAITASNIKNELKDWIIGDSVSIAVADELNKLKLSDEMSEVAIERRILESSELMELMRAIQPLQTSTIIQQHHNGEGDNVGRDKVINSNERK